MSSKFLQWSAYLLIALNLSAAQTEFRRVCEDHQLDVGIRRGPEDAEATHTCVPGPWNGRCFVQDAFGGFNCTGDYQLQGGLPNRESLCCKKQGFALVDCFIPSRLFSFRDGFNIQHRGTVLRSIVSYPTPNDQTTFIVELCFLYKWRQEFYPELL
ncbi:uncharacterized protein LOC125662301 [Ostrea edulis]|uniref:uncharacterized protein LOC125662301 n=1 Tax=Ostrea edulis TaxID=37623 RepID=UPI002094EDFA|nr:uncharacterized protein LOC125662301 [Ostrea edulis]XP_048750428.1 uncharacterized protein LOC125662301 [Ostrea edulis]